MKIELNQTTFIRLVRFYLLALLLALAAAALEWLLWSDFSDEFDTLSSRHFGEPSDLVLFGMGGFGLLALIAHVGSAFALMSFRRWARPLFWTSMLAMFAVGLMPSLGNSWSGFLSAMTEMISSALFGAILLLAYARDYGTEWFHKATLEEIF